MNKQINRRDWNSKKRVLTEYSAGFSAYDQLYGEEQRMKYERCSRYLLGDGKKTVLDCGCGTGMLLEQLAGQSRYLVGVDYSQAMLQLAKTRVGPARNVGLVCADADNLPFGSETFDQVASFTMLGNMPNIDETIREIARVARNGAQILLSFVKKNITTVEILASLEVARLNVEEFVDEESLKDWIAIGKKLSESTSDQ